MAYVIESHVEFKCIESSALKPLACLVISVASRWSLACRGLGATVNFCDVEIYEVVVADNTFCHCKFSSLS